MTTSPSVVNTKTEAFFFAQFTTGPKIELGTTKEFTKIVKFRQTCISADLRQKTEWLQPVFFLPFQVLLKLIGVCQNGDVCVTSH